MAPAPPPFKSLAIGTTSTATLRPEQIGRMFQVQATAAAVRDAMKRAAIADAADVHWVQVKCPLLTKKRIAAAVSRGEITATDDPYASMALSCAASAFGVAVALGEVEIAGLDDRAISRDFGLWSSCASASAGVELMHNLIIVLGNSAAWSGDNVVGHAVMRDAIDLPSVVPHMKIRAGERFVCVGPDGGGYGNLLARETERVRDDVADGLLSPEPARREYGIVLTPAGKVDELETARLRSEMSAA